MFDERRGIRRDLYARCMCVSHRPLQGERTYTLVLLLFVDTRFGMFDEPSSRLVPLRRVGLHYTYMKWNG